MKPREILFGSDDNLRSGWRALIFVAIFGLCGFIVSSAIVVSLSAFDIGFGNSTAAVFAVQGTASFAAALLTGWICGKYLEGLPFRALGAWFTSGWARDLTLGTLVGALTLSLAVLIGSLFGDLDFTCNAGAPAGSIANTLAVSFVVFAVAAAFEEVLFRGYVLQTFARAGLAVPAIVFIAILFGAVHLGNPNAGYLSSLNTALAGIWFGVAYLKTRNLWFVWGIHLMWNWMLGAIYGIEVSGLTEITHSPLFIEIDHGPTLLTGAEYGIEASISCTIALIVSTVALYLLPLKADEELQALTSNRLDLK